MEILMVEILVTETEMETVLIKVREMVT